MLEMNFCVVGVVFQVRHDHADDFCIDRVQNGFHQVMGHWPGRRDALERKADRAGFRLSHPDGQHVRRVFIPENHDIGVIVRVEHQTSDLHLKHRSHPATCARDSCVSPLAVAYSLSLASHSTTDLSDLSTKPARWKEWRPHGKFSRSKAFPEMDGDVHIARRSKASAATEGSRRRPGSSDG